MTNIPAGWYPDPSGSDQQRWWNGVAWSEQFAPNAAPVASALPAAQPYTLNAQPYAYVGVPTAPAGTKPYTPWIWILALLPIVALINTVAVLATTDVASIADPDADLGYTSTDLLTGLLGWVIIGLSVLFGILDHRELKRRGVERPFHWAWIFFMIISVPVYMIGRSVVIRRRVGSGLAPMFVNLGIYLVTFIVSIVFGVALVASVIQDTPGL